MKEKRLDQRIVSNYFSFLFFLLRGIGIGIAQNILREIQTDKIYM